MQTSEIYADYLTTLHNSHRGLQDIGWMDFKICQDIFFHGLN